MDKAETLSHLANVLIRVTTEQRAQEVLSRAEHRSGLAWSATMTDAHYDAIIQALIEEGGRIRAVAEQIARWNSDDPAAGGP